MKKILKAKFLIPFALISIFGFVCIQKCVQKNDIKRNGILVNATITDYLGTVKGGSGINPNFRCEFMYKGERKSLITQSGVTSKGFSYVGRTFPALYSEKTILPPIF